MSERIRLGIVGYGNLGRGVEHAVAQNSDMDLVAVFTRRDPDQVATVDPAVAVHRLDDMASFAGRLDVAVLCGGSRADLPEQAPRVAAMFNTVDSFDTHAEVNTHFAAVDEPARANGNTALISAGWDPGMFSLARLFGEVVLAEGSTHTFWGRGLSQGHSDALRRVPGVAGGVQYTIPSEEAMDLARSRGTAVPAEQRHVRECHVVLEPGADPDEVEHEIVTMPHYFAESDTRVNFITAEELERDHAAMPHGGFVIRHGTTRSGAEHSVEFSLALGSNPEFTASVLVACARAVHRLNQRGEVGALTMFDVPPALLSPRDPTELRAGLL